jgi:hypothetical protein
MGERKQRILSALHAKRREARRMARQRREETARILRTLRGEPPSGSTVAESTGTG